MDCSFSKEKSALFNLYAHTVAVIRIRLSKKKQSIAYIYILKHFLLFDQAFEMKCKYNAIYCNNRNRQIQMHESLAICVRPFINKTKFD